MCSSKLPVSRICFPQFQQIAEKFTRVVLCSWLQILSRDEVLGRNCRIRGFVLHNHVRKQEVYVISVNFFLIFGSCLSTELSEFVLF